MKNPSWKDKLILIAEDDGVSIPSKEAGIVNKSLLLPLPVLLLPCKKP